MDNKDMKKQSTSFKLERFLNDPTHSIVKDVGKWEFV